MDSEITPTKSVHIELKNIPSFMQHSEINEFYSLFGKVNCVKFQNESFATIEFENKCFFDPNFFDNIYGVPFTPAYRIDECFLNDSFLSDLLSILENFNCKSKSIEKICDINRMKADDELLTYHICIYCFSCADFQCERCESPYCSAKCQKMDWLDHKKSCSPKSQSKIKTMARKKE